MRRGMHAFTLVEMLVVIAILAMLSGLIFWSTEESRLDKVSRAARELAVTLEKARIMAMRTGDAHCVTFNIQNAGDGSILRNHPEGAPEGTPGGHWYQLIGPDTVPGTYGDGTVPTTWWRHEKGSQRPFLGDFVDVVQRSAVEDRHHLPQGVRFLALSEEDLGNDGEEKGSGLGLTADWYPRPWHGWFDPATGRLYAWGAYNRDLESGPWCGRTGFGYQGVDGLIPWDPAADTNMHPPEVWGLIHEDATAMRPDEVGKEMKASILNDLTGDDHWEGPDDTVLPGTPRALLNGHWLDWAIVFEPDGSAFRWTGRARDTYFGKARNQIAVRDDLRATGGTTITLAPDVDPQDHLVPDPIYEARPDPISGAPQYDRFGSVEHALRSITPLVRVRVIYRSGEVQVLSREHEESRLQTGDLIR